MPLQGLHPRSRSVSVEGAEGVRQLSLDGSDGPRFRPRYAPAPEASTVVCAPESSADCASECESGACRPGGVGERPDQTERRADDIGRDIHEVLNFNSSVYDLTIQHSCQAAHTRWSKVGVATLATVLALQILNVYMQMTILFEVEELVAVPAKAHAQQLYRDFTDECYGAEPGDDYVLTLEVRERFAAWEGAAKSELCQFPLTCPSFAATIMLIWTFFLVCESKQTAALSWHVVRLERPMEGHVTFRGREEDMLVTHMSRRLKAWVAITVLLPKFAIAAVLWYVGARWLMAAPGIDNLVLNSLALTFICEIDELIFQTCVPESAKSSLEKTRLPVPPLKYAPTVWVPVEMVCTAIGCVALALLYLYHLQDALPDYRWDLAGVCRHAESHFTLFSALRRRG